MSVDITGGNYTNFNPSKYVEETFEVDELKNNSEINQI